MLVLSREKGERIMIGPDIVVTIVEVRGDKVRIGIDAPRNINVHREEIYDAINPDSPIKRRPKRVVTVQDKLKAQARQPAPDEGTLGGSTQEASGVGNVKSGT